jgi:peptidoglycan-associated lipoprotein
MQTKHLIILLTTCLLAVGCAKKPKPDETTGDAVGAGEGEISRQAGIDTGGVAGGTEYLEPGMLPGDSTLIEQTTIYFDFDTARIRPEFSDALSAHARRLVGNQGLNVRLEGHADERGSREYNIGLGERRAQAVRQVLMLQGVSSAQITTVSYGEERPAVQGSDEAAWEQNRRVEIVYSE